MAEARHHLGAVRASEVGQANPGGRYQAVARGHQIGVFRTWALARPLVIRYPNNSYKSFGTIAEAWLHVDQELFGLGFLIPPLP